MRLLAPLLVLLLAAGCASEPAPPSTQVASAAGAVPAAAASAPQQVCHREASVGSNMPHTVCETPGSSPDSTAIGNAADALSRQIGFSQQMLGRASGGH